MPLHGYQRRLIHFPKYDPSQLIHKGVGCCYSTTRTREYIFSNALYIQLPLKIAEKLQLNKIWQSGC